MAALNDLPTLERWEVLKRRGVPMSAAQFAEACSIPLDEALRSLDLLVAGGFVLPKKATGRCRHATFVATAEDIVVTWNGRCEQHRRWVDSQRHARRAHIRKLIDESIGDGQTLGQPRLFSEKFRILSLHYSERKRIHQILQHAFEAIDEIEREGWARQRAESAEAPPAAHSEEKRLNYVIAMHMVPAGENTLPLPSISAVEETLVAQVVARAESEPKRVLTGREFEIAARLANGRSRPEVARALGISTNTVASTTKRIYSKLKVKSRAEFAALMKDRVAT